MAEVQNVYHKADFSRSYAYISAGIWPTAGDDNKEIASQLIQQNNAYLEPYFPAETNSCRIPRNKSTIRAIARFVQKWRVRLCVAPRNGTRRWRQRSLRPTLIATIARMSLSARVFADVQSCKTRAYFTIVSRTIV